MTQDFDRNVLPGRAAGSPLRFSRHESLWAACAPYYSDRDLAHDTHHVLRVYRWALRLAPEAGADVDLAGAAALVHDLDATPKNSPQRSLSSERSAGLAAPLLLSAGYDEFTEVAPICAAVRGSGWSRGEPAHDALALVLQEADRLDALGAIGIARCFATHQAMAGAGSCLFHPDDPLGETARSLNDALIAADHFQVKLLKIAATLTLPSARTEATRRHAALVSYLTSLHQESR